MYPVKPTMIPKLEFSFVTSQEKFDIMTSVPEKAVVETVGQQIKDNRCFRDRNTKIIFEDELNRLMFSRARGVPKKMKKPVKESVESPYLKK